MGEQVANQAKESAEAAPAEVKNDALRAEMDSIKQQAAAAAAQQKEAAQTVEQKADSNKDKRAALDFGAGKGGDEKKLEASTDFAWVDSSEDDSSAESLSS